MSTLLLIIGGQIPAHDYPAATAVLAAVLRQAGYAVRAIAAPPAAADLAGAAAVVLFTDGDFFPPDAITRLTDFVHRGGGLVTLHTAAGTNKDSPAFAELVGSQIQGGIVAPHTAHIVDAHHPITAGLSDFDLDDEIHELKPAADYHTLIDADMNGHRQPLAYVKQAAAGRTVHLATGHSIAGISNPTLQEVFRRAVRFVAKE